MQKVLFINILIINFLLEINEKTFANGINGKLPFSKDLNSMQIFYHLENTDLNKDSYFINNKTSKNFFKNIQLKLVDFKLEFGYDSKNNILLGDEISPDNCRLWDLKQKNDIIVSLDKDRFRNDLGGLIEAYSEINRRINDFI